MELGELEVNVNQRLAKLLNFPPRTLSATLRLVADDLPTMTINCHPSEHDLEAISREFELVPVEEIRQLRDEVRVLRKVVLTAAGMAPKQGLLGGLLTAAAWCLTAKAWP